MEKVSEYGYFTGFAFFLLHGYGPKGSFSACTCWGLVVLDGPIDSVDLPEVVRRTQWEVFLGEF